MTFGEKLKAARIEAGLKQSELAKQLNTTGNTISNWENNVSKPDLATLPFICGILHTTASRLLDATIPEDEVSIPELDWIRKYRTISKYSPDGAVVVDTVLNREFATAEKLKAQEERIEQMGMEASEEIVPMRVLAYYGKIAAAGKSCGFIDMLDGTIECRADECKNADYAIGVWGDSMNPTYCDGDIVYVRKDVRPGIGEIGIFQKDNEIYIKEVGKNCLISHNPEYKPIPNDSTITYLGKVVGKAENIDA